MSAHAFLPGRRLAGESARHLGPEPVVMVEDAPPLVLGEAARVDCPAVGGQAAEPRKLMHIFINAKQKLAKKVNCHIMGQHVIRI
jgi:hypothetical protein